MHGRRDLTILPVGLEAVFYTDSAVTMRRYRVMRDGLVDTERSLIRIVYSGVGKGQCARLHRNLALHSIEAEAIIPGRKFQGEDPYHVGDEDYNLELPEDFEWDVDTGQGNEHDWNDITIEQINLARPGGTKSGIADGFPTWLKSIDLRERMEIHDELTKEYVSLDKDTLYLPHNRDAHMHRKIEKVASRQTDDDGNIKSKPRFAAGQIPNRAIVHDNYYLADIATSIGVGTHPPEPFNALLPPPDVRNDPHGPRFFISHLAEVNDRSVTTHFKSIESSALCQRHSRRGRHGLLTRVIKNNLISSLKLNL